jgi:glycosyltransferase involved in cell wall biosynthesis
MRIVQLVNNLEVGGTERLVVDLASSLHARGHEVSIVCLRAGRALAPIVEKVGIEVFSLNKPEGPRPGVLFDFMRYLKKRRVDVVHSHNPLVHHYAVLAGRLARVPVIVNTIHGIGNISEKVGLKERLYRISCLMSSRVVAVCPMALRTFAAGSVIPRSKLMAINNGIPLESFVGIQREERHAGFTFGTVGRLVPVKDHRTLLRAFKDVVSQRADSRLEVLGDGPLRAELEAYAADLGIASAVRFHGYSSDVAGFLATIDAFILCSVSEGLPLGVLEAMATALPIVGTDVGGMRDLLEGGHCGWVVPPSNASELARALLSAAATTAVERRDMGLRARQHVTLDYSQSRMTEEYERLFVELLGRQGRSETGVRARS